MFNLAPQVTIPVHTVTLCLLLRLPIPLSARSPLKGGPKNVCHLVTSTNLPILVRPGNLDIALGSVSKLLKQLRINLCQGKSNEWK
jgi:hypothetical protein